MTRKLKKSQYVGQSATAKRRSARTLGSYGGRAKRRRGKKGRR